MSKEGFKPLNLAPIEAVYKTTPAPPDKRQDGRRIILGKNNAAIAVDVFPNHPPKVRIISWTNEELVSMANIKSVEVVEQGLHIKNKQSDCMVSNEGHVVFTRVPPPPPPAILEMSSGGLLRRDILGNEYTQHMLEIAGNAEQAEFKDMECVVMSVPSAETRGKGKPLTFYVKEFLDPDDPEKIKVWEVKAYKNTKSPEKDQMEKVRKLRLKKGDKIYVQGVLKKWEDYTIGGEKILRECINISRTIEVRERQGKAVRQKNIQET